MFAIVTEAAPTSAEPWFWLAVTLDNRGDEEEAIPAYRRAIELGLAKDKLGKAWTWLASSLSKTGSVDEAAAALEEAERVGGYRPRAEYERVALRVRRRLERR